MPYETALFLDKFLRWAIPIGLPLLFVWLVWSEYTRQPPTKEQKERSEKIFMFVLYTWFGLFCAFAVLGIGFVLFDWVQALFLS